MRNKLSLFLFSAALVGLFGLSDAWGQASRGNIRGTVTDDQGGALPGVTVTASSPAMIQPRTVVTGENGEFNIPAVPIGTYKVEASLASFAPASVADVRVLLGGSAQVKIQMKLQTAIGESMEVTGEAPVLDATDHSTGGHISSEELVKVPTARDPWAVLALVPGIQSDRVNVGGSESGQQANFVSKGSPTSQTSWSIDGVTITDAGAIGSSPTYFDFGAIEEVQVNTGGADVSQLSGGVGINVVTKRGSNDFHGSARTFFSNDSLQSDNAGDIQDAEINGTQPYKPYASAADVPNAAALAAPFLPAKNDQLLEFGGELGGPIVKDKVWFWGSINRNKVEQFLNRYDKKLFVQENKLEQQADNTTLINYAAKLSGQITESNEANTFFHFGDKQKDGRTQQPIRDSASAWKQKGGTPVFKIEDQQVFGSNGLLAGKFAYVGGGFSLHPKGSKAEGGPGLQTVWDYSADSWSENFLQYDTDRPQTMFNLDGSYFAALGSTDNDFKFGFSFRSTPVESSTVWDGGGYVVENFGAPFAQFTVQDDYTVKYKGNTVSLYGSDTINAGNLTVDIGLRYDHQTAKNDVSVRQRNVFLGDYMDKLEYDPEAAGEEAITYDLVSPRVGLSYQLGEKTLLKANYALYADQIGPSIATNINPVGSQYLYTYFYDTNGDHQAQFSELINQGEGYPCGGYCTGGGNIDPSNPNSLSTLNQIDADLTSPKTNELGFSVTQQLGGDTSVGVNVTYRNRSDVLVNLPLVTDATGNVRPLEFSDWHALPEVSFAGAPNGNYEGEFTVAPFSVTPYALNAGITPTGGTLTTNREGYSEKYLGAEFLFQKRFSKQWSIAGNLSLNDLTASFTPFGEGDFPDYNTTISNNHIDGGAVAPAAGSASGAKGQVFFNAKWQSNLRGTYTVPGIDLDLGATLTVRQGYPTPFIYSYRGPAGSKLTPTGSRTVNLLANKDLDAVRMATMSDLDVRLGREFKFGAEGRYSLEASLDMFNVLNSNVLLQHNRTVSTTGTALNASFLRPLEILAPRTIRVSGRLKF